MRLIEPQLPQESGKADRSGRLDFFKTISLFSRCHCGRESFSGLKRKLLEGLYTAQGCEAVEAPFVAPLLSGQQDPARPADSLEPQNVQKSLGTTPPARIPVTTFSYFRKSQPLNLHFVTGSLGEVVAGGRQKLSPNCVFVAPETGPRFLDSWDPGIRPTVSTRAELESRYQAQLNGWLEGPIFVSFLLIMGVNKRPNISGAKILVSGK